MGQTERGTAPLRKIAFANRGYFSAGGKDALKVWDVRNGKTELLTTADSKWSDLHDLHFLEEDVIHSVQMKQNTISLWRTKLSVPDEINLTCSESEDDDLKEDLNGDDVGEQSADSESYESDFGEDSVEPKIEDANAGEQKESELSKA